ncbi:zinc-dependent metalloprotease [bacterium]|jgi:hypothetical protein|nr:zinc-dependent metalloprotease [bacterium]|tara:strand:- start:239 stop:1762 length:1524 start_codon:yes stop_codon:yes gene_type:complete
MNIKPRLLILALFVATTIVTVSAQHQHRGECGVTYEMEQQLPVYSKKDVQLFKEANPERFASINIPVMFHTVANSVGEGRVKRKDILKSLCRMNNDYAEHGVVYYLKDGGFNELDNSNIFSNVSMNGDLVQTFKDGAAVDIFITENADTGSSLGTTLGFYSPGGDYIIIRKKEMADSSGTMSHEVGHYFSLRHPHSGWDQPYDIGTYGNSVPFNTVPGTGALIELMDGSNCEDSGDKICDTAPDYLLGFTTQACFDNFSVFDPNGDALESDETLSMGYFNNCPKYVFSPQQIDRAKLNIASPGRNFLLNTHTPNETEITGDLAITSPGFQETVETYNGVEVSWEGVQDADLYLVEIVNFADPADFYEYTTPNEALFVTDLEPNKVYFLNVKPYNDAYTCYPEVGLPFLTGDVETSLNDPSFVSDFVVYPNPSYTNQDIIVDMTSEWSGNATLSISDLAGKVIKHQAIQISNGKQQLVTNQSGDIQSGIYFLKLSTVQGNVTRKIVIH